MIRKITPGDREAFLSLERAFYNSDAVLAPVDPAFHENTFAELMRSGEYLSCYLLFADGPGPAERESAPAGYALLSRSFSPEAGGIVVWLEEFFLLPAFRGAGLGTAFFAYMKKNIPAARYRLEVEPENTGAVALYRRQGFRELPYGQMVLDTGGKG